MRFRSLVSVLAAAALIVGACSSNTTTSPTPVGPQSSASTGPSQQPTASGTASDACGRALPSAGNARSRSERDTRVRARPTSPGASPTPKPPKPLPAYITHGKRKGTDKVIALTFDADMYPFMYATKDSYHEYDPRVLKLIKDNDLHATIFANGLYLKAYPEVITDLAKPPGIEIGNHSWDHGAWPGCQAKDPLAPPVTDKKAEITKAAKIIKDTLGKAPDWFRFPGFCYSSASDLDLVKSLGEWPVGNDCFFGDSAGWSTSQQVASVENTCQNGSIVITHLDNTQVPPRTSTRRSSSSSRGGRRTAGRS